ncbi:protein-tyrosine-phosphatase/DNA-binding HxlR family transcriptional regulator [Kribbella aluminosa]|uniref:Protein-tyrosine-phosphatase/DNA-binding HxlR family transcriptional regulator n=1 Tax=Kribbella aluminosa TaxID=416017 RepID=A0ABS4UVJ5_9ACTN|nr:helix-turn-helix domain-containing protein [Kribbella aluminosa]MBP2355670.1 protein-tyrosine-phosphatase/DNA-binding HxlR family transcriptional regulator [Kribbella aluminosa]
MNTERFNLAERARIHAALGDPARLAIVDALVGGDAAPGELGAALDLPTNLIAHHLKVLEDAGLVVRTRSEGDRRRTYVRLEPEALSAIATPVLLAAKRVVFVCTQNSARSQLAAAIWSRRSHVPAVSAGTEPADRVHPRTLKVARRHGLDPSGWRPVQLRDVVHPDDLLIAVCDNAHEQLVAERLVPEHLPPERLVPEHVVPEHVVPEHVVPLHLLPEHLPSEHLPSEHLPSEHLLHEHLVPEPLLSEQRPRLHWSVPDPAPADTDAAFEAAYSELADRIDRLAPALAPGQVRRG